MGVLSATADGIMTVTSRSAHDHRRHVSANSSYRRGVAMPDSSRRFVKVSPPISRRSRHPPARGPEQEDREAGGQQEPSGGFRAWLQHAIEGYRHERAWVYGGVMGA